MVTVETPDAAAARLRHGCTLTVSGLVGSIVPETTLRAIRRRFEDTGQPRDTTVIFPVAVGDVHDSPGVDHLAAEGLVRTVIGGSFVYGKRPLSDEEPALTTLIAENKVLAYNFSIGTVFSALRESGARRPGLVTRVGIGTFQDPRVRGGRLNDVSPKQYVQIITLDDEEFLHYRLPPVDVALLRASVADTSGNIAMTREVTEGGLLVQAMAARANRGQVIVQVEDIVEVGTLNPRLVAIPANLVDAVVLVPGEQQATGVAYDPTLSNESPFEGPPPKPQLGDAERLILSRVAKLLRTGDLVILGFGMPSHLPGSEGVPDGVRFTVEHGAIGGWPTSGLQFGGARNAEALLPTPSMFDLINGGGCDVACLGFAEVDARGSVNVSRLPTGLPGSGGFTDITAATRRLVFCGTFTAGGLEVRGEHDGAVKILREGRFRKFVDSPRELTFVAGALPDQEVTFVTERCTVTRRDEALVVEEVYPGVEFERDVAGQCDFPLLRHLG